MHTAAGEGDLSSDRLSHLKIVASGFGPFIYGLLEDPSFESFQQSCESVWQAVEETPRLTEFLVSIIWIICSAWGLSLARMGAYIYIYSRKAYAYT